MGEDEKPFGAENVKGAENTRGREEVRGRENIVGAEDRPAPQAEIDQKQLVKAADAINAAADYLVGAAKILERQGWAAARIKDAKGHPIELWGKDEALQELADRLKGIANEITAEAEAD